MMETIDIPETNSRTILSQFHYYDSSVYEDKERNKYVAGVPELLTADCKDLPERRDGLQTFNAKKKKKQLYMGQGAPRFKSHAPRESKQKSKVHPKSPESDYDKFMEDFMRCKESDKNAKLKFPISGRRRMTKLDECMPERLQDLMDMCRTDDGHLKKSQFVDDEPVPDFTEFMEEPFPKGKQGPLSGVLAFPQPTTNESINFENILKEQCELNRKFKKISSDLPEEVGRQEASDEEEDLDEDKLSLFDVFRETDAIVRPKSPTYGEKLRKHLWPELYQQPIKLYSHQCYPMDQPEKLIPDAILQINSKNQYRNEWEIAPVDTLERIREKMEQKKGIDGKKDEKIKKIHDDKGAGVTKLIVMKKKGNEGQQRAARSKQRTSSLKTTKSVKGPKVDATDLAAFRASERAADAIPGPGKYELPRWPFEKELAENTYPFNSNTKRDISLMKTSKGVPGIGTYKFRDRWKQRFGPTPTQGSFGGTLAILPAFQMRCGDKLLEKCVGCTKVPNETEYWVSYPFGVLCNECYKKESDQHNMFNFVELDSFKASRHCSFWHEHCGKKMHLVRPKKELVRVLRKEAYFAQFLGESKKKLKMPTLKDIAAWHRRKCYLIERNKSAAKKVITYVPEKVKTKGKKPLLKRDDRKIEPGYIKVPPYLFEVLDPVWPNVLKGITAFEEELPGRRTPPEWQESETKCLEGIKKIVEEEMEEAAEEGEEESEEDMDADAFDDQDQKGGEQQEDEEVAELEEDGEEAVYNSACEILRVMKMMGDEPQLPEVRPIIDLKKTLPALLRKELPMEEIPISRKYLPWFLRRKMEERSTLEEEDEGEVKKKKKRKRADGAAVRIIIDRNDNLVDENLFKELSENCGSVPPHVYRRMQLASIMEAKSFGGHRFYSNRLPIMYAAMEEKFKEKLALIKEPKEIIEGYLSQTIPQNYISFNAIQLAKAKKILDEKKEEGRRKRLKELLVKMSRKPGDTRVGIPGARKYKLPSRKLFYYVCD